MNGKKTPPAAFGHYSEQSPAVTSARSSSVTIAERAHIENTQYPFRTPMRINDHSELPTTPCRVSSRERLYTLQSCRVSSRGWRLYALQSCRVSSRGWRLYALQSCRVSSRDWRLYALQSCRVAPVETLRGYVGEFWTDLRKCIC